MRQEMSIVVTDDRSMSSILLQVVRAGKKRRFVILFAPHAPSHESWAGGTEALIDMSGSLAVCGGGQCRWCG